MKRLFVRAKIHRATVTDANLEYMGSITICPNLMAQVGIVPFEFVHVNNVRNGMHWETYAIAGETGQIVLNGPPAHHFQRGDKVIILALAELEPSEISRFVHQTILVDPVNRPTKRITHSLSDRTGAIEVLTNTVDIVSNPGYSPP
jgi:aspartate 1-decarboxylase